MKKKFLFGILLVLMLVVAGCSPNTSGGTEPAAPLDVEEPAEPQTTEEPATVDESNDMDQSEQSEEPAAEADEVEITYLDDFVFEDVDGNEVRMSDYAGKVVVIDYWATSCGYCIKEMPVLRELEAEYDDLVILKVSIGDNQKSLQNFIDKETEKGVVFKHPLLLDENNSAWGFNVTGTPTKIFVGPNREFIGAVPGAREYEDNKALFDRTFEILDEIGVETY